MFGRRQPRIPPTWRREQVPPCPQCGGGGGDAVHRSCREKRGRKIDEGHLYVDIATGKSHCIKCGFIGPFGEYTSYCACGAKYIGGEMWQGMAAEISTMGDATWLRGQTTVQGMPVPVCLGYYRCALCDAHEDDREIVSMDHGGLCPDCLEQARRKSRSRLHFGKRGECRFCGRSSRQVSKMVLIDKIRVFRKSRFLFICDTCVWSAQ